MGETGGARHFLICKAEAVFGYFIFFPDYAGMVAADVGCDFCFVNVDAVECSATTECCF